MPSDYITYSIQDGSGTTSTVEHRDAKPIGNIKYLLERVELSDLTDGEAADGTCNLSNTLPADVIVLGTRLDVVTAFDGTSSATMSVGTAADPDRFCAAKSVFTEDASLVDTPVGDAAVDAETTVLITVTEDDDFTDFTEGVVDVTIVYMEI